MFIFRERAREGEREGEKHRYMHAPAGNLALFSLQSCEGLRSSALRWRPSAAPSSINCTVFPFTFRSLIYPESILFMVLGWFVLHVTSHSLKSDSCPPWLMVPPLSSEWVQLSLCSLICAWFIFLVLALILIFTAAALKHFNFWFKFW